MFLCVHIRIPIKTYVFCVCTTIVTEQEFGSTGPFLRQLGAHKLQWTGETGAGHRRGPSTRAAFSWLLAKRFYQGPLKGPRGPFKGSRVPFQGHRVPSKDPAVLLRDPGALLKGPGVRLKDPEVLQKDPGILLKDPGVFSGSDQRRTLGRA